MLGFICLFGLGLTAALSYKAFSDKKDASEKLERVQAHIARKEALEKESNITGQNNMARNTENETQKED